MRVKASETDEFWIRHGFRGGVSEALETFASFLAATPLGVAAEPERELTEAEHRLLDEGGFPKPQPDEQGSAGNELSMLAVSYAEMCAQALTTKEAARLLQVQPSRIRQRLGERTLFGIEKQDHWILPRFQFDDGQIVPGMGKVLQVLDETLHPVTVERFFATPQPELYADEVGRDLTPREWLQAGYDPAPVIRLARDL
jgi:hypothetical protein